ncbi:hypothetical protein ALC56_08556, partial [Trachymyrmex septentrionalis]
CSNDSDRDVDEQPWAMAKRTDISSPPLRRRRRRRRRRRLQCEKTRRARKPRTRRRAGRSRYLASKQASKQAWCLKPSLRTFPRFTGDLPVPHKLFARASKDRAPPSEFSSC